MWRYRRSSGSSPEPSGRNDRDSGISIPSERASYTTQGSGAPHGGRNSRKPVSSQARPLDHPSSKSVHWSQEALSGVRYHANKALALLDPGTGSSDTSSLEEELRSRTPKPVAAKATIEEHNEKPPIRRVDGICHAGEAKDVTVQLSLELREDLTNDVEQLRFLVQLGRFHAAKKQFTKYLEPHAYHPYVRVEYANMLWRQRDFNSLAQLVAQPLGGTEDDRPHLQDDVHLDVGLHQDEHTSARELQALQKYWSVLRTYTLAAHDIAQLTDTDRDELQEAVQALEKVLRRADKAISSNEIRIFDLLTHLYDNDPSAFTERNLGRNSFVNSVKIFEGWGGFYESLLRQGRIWDFRDLFCGLARTTGYENALSSMLGMPTSSTTATRSATKQLIADWTNALPENDLSTKMALLSLCMHAPSMTMPFHTSAVRSDADCLDEFTPLAQSVLWHHPEALKSRPYLDWVLCKVYHTNAQGRKDQADVAALMSVWPGVFMHDESLPVYIPRRHENPGWKIPDAQPEFKNAVQMALRTAREIGDCGVQVAALTTLICISNDPSDAFEELGTLLKLLGNSTGYAHLLTSKYLLSTTSELRKKLKHEVAALLSQPGPLRAMRPDVAWMVQMLYVKLEGPNSLLSRGPRSDANSLEMSGRLSKALQHSIFMGSPFTEEDIQCRQVDVGALKLRPQRYTTMGRQASQSHPFDRQLFSTGPKSIPKPRHQPVHYKPPFESLQQRSRPSQRINTLPSPPHAGFNEQRKSETPVIERQGTRRNQEGERERAAPFSSGNLGNPFQEPQQPGPSRLSPLTNTHYEEWLLSRAISILKVNRRIAADEGDEDRAKALAESCSGIDQELNRMTSRRHEAARHLTEPPKSQLDNEESARQRPVPTDERGEPSACSAPLPSEVGPPMPPAFSGQARMEERQDDGENTSAATATNRQQFGLFTSEKGDEEESSSTSASSGKASSGNNPWRVLAP